MIVLKFGGSSVASHKEIIQVAEIIKKVSQQEPVVVTVSAMKGVTDTLYDCAQAAQRGDDRYQTLIADLEDKHLFTIRELIAVRKQSGIITQIKMWLNHLEDICRGVYLIRELSPKSMDYIYSFGELMSAKILAQALRHLDTEAEFFDSRDLIQTDRSFGRAEVDQSKTFSRMQDKLSDVDVNHPVVLPGFIASSYKGETTTLGRGGSDYTASLVASALEADRLEIWTDVEGVYTADPRIVKKARPVKELSYQEAMELAHFGAKVIYPPTIQPVMERDIPILIKNTFEPQKEGTLIKREVELTENIARGVSSLDDVALLTLSGSSMIGVPGVAARLFKALADHQINIMLITQASSEHTITVGLGEEVLEEAEHVVEEEFNNEIALHKIDKPTVVGGLSVVSLVGDGMQMHPGIAGKFFSAMGHRDVNIIAIAQGSSERNISAVVKTSDKQAAIQALHDTFFNS